MIALKAFGDPSFTQILSDAYNLSGLEVVFILALSFIIILISEPIYQKYISSIDLDDEPVVLKKHSFFTRFIVLFFVIMLMITPVFILLKTSFFI
ncbi:MAG: hypothetical protein JXR05_16400 [Flavobacteriaceae bacterium]